MFAAVVAPLFGCFYSPGKPSPRAALCSLLAGTITRVVLEFSLPKDGILILPFKADEFLNFGSAASAKIPTFFDEPAEALWDPAVEQCNSSRFEDYTGVDSFASFICSVVVFVVVTLLEGDGSQPLFDFPGLHPYEKLLAHSPDDDVVKKVDNTNKTDKLEEAVPVVEEEESEAYA